MARSVSCTIMAYNEEATLEEATRDVVEALAAFGDRDFEVLIVDDGSTDGTAEIAARMARRYPQVRVITHPQNRGPGSALITGFAESRCEIVCFHPADQQIPFAEVAMLLPLLDEHDVIVGQRTARTGYTVMRRLSSHVYIALVHLLFGLRQYRDFNFIYLYRKEVLDKIALETHGVFMPTEVLIKAVAGGGRVTAATVTCLPRRAGVATCGRPSVIAETLAQMIRFWGRWQLRRLSGR
jgi:glycosyltransferase involved in cell wall biosynthesis